MRPTVGRSGPGSPPGGAPAGTAVRQASCAGGVTFSVPPWQAAARVGLSSGYLQRQDRNVDGEGRRLRTGGRTVDPHRSDPLDLLDPLDRTVGLRLGAGIRTRVATARRPPRGARILLLDNRSAVAGVTPGGAARADRAVRTGHCLDRPVHRRGDSAIRRGVLMIRSMPTHVR